MLNNNLSVAGIADTIVSAVTRFNTASPANNTHHRTQVELFNSLIHRPDAVTIVPQIGNISMAKPTTIPGDHYLTSLIKKIDNWRNSGKSYLANIQDSIQKHPLNRASMMKMQLDLLKFSLGYEMTAKLVGKGIGAIDTLLRSQ